MVTGPRSSDSSESYSDNSGKNRNNENELTGFCEPYRGSVCSQFIGNASIYVLNPYSQDQVEAKLSAAFTVVATSHDVSPQCHRFAIPSLCFGAFPLCDEYSHDPRPRKVLFSSFSSLLRLSFSFLLLLSFSFLLLLSLSPKGYFWTSLKVCSEPEPLSDKCDLLCLNICLTTISFSSLSLSLPLFFLYFYFLLFLFPSFTRFSFLVF